MVKSNLFLRIISSVILIPIAVLLILKAHPYLIFSVLALIMAGSVFEFFTLLEGVKLSDKIFAIIINFFVLLAASFTGEHLHLIISFLFCLTATYILFNNELKDYVFSLGTQAFCIIYFSLLLSFSFRLLELPQGRVWLIFLLSVNWMTDIVAYFVGTRWGKHKLSVISPKKSFEGLIGGVIGGVLTAGLVNFIVLKNENWFAVLFLGLAGSVVGQLSDLVESGIKRCTGHKDSGSIIPGHGGIMDRFDSLYFTGLLFYFFGKYILN